MTPRVLTVDAGTTSVKVCLFEKDLTLLAKSVQEYSLAASSGRVEAEGGTYIEAVRRGVRAMGSLAGGVTAVCLTTQGETLTVTDPDGTPLRPFIVWLDDRANEEAEALRKLFRAARPDRDPSPGQGAVAEKARERPLCPREQAPASGGLSFKVYDGPVRHGENAPDLHRLVQPPQGLLVARGPCRGGASGGSAPRAA